MSATKTLTVQYFAVLREQRGVSSETCSTAASTLRELYAELKSSHGFSLPEDRVKVAVNDEFADWDSQVLENSKVVFIPPVAGG